ncbi:Hydroxysteroid dehydrogenase-like protein [Lachnellula subtilissima]|uniref:Hydroxysteroid dehydrogenase-like protein n=1 Tax=Lachnellula subtilissima TaxID=602034 RepID=A0A8H8UBJ6_9HELO|nr:Hydroxysteroid dehydrogenase-like protein [Lachnellula subtilissima]
MSSPPIWFITGCSSGFGTSLALLALRSGHKVIATSRNPSKTPGLVSEVESLGGVWHTLDVCAPEPELAKAVEKAINVWGRIDILVNAAGYALLGAFETIRSTRPNGHKLLRPPHPNPADPPLDAPPPLRHRRPNKQRHRPRSQALAVPVFRLQIRARGLLRSPVPRSQAPRDPRLLVEPGWFGTNFSRALARPEAALPGEYEGTVVKQVLDATVALGGVGARAPNDVEKGCRAVFDVVMGRGLGEGVEETIRLPLGKDCVARIRVKIEEHRHMLDVTEKLWSSTDVD